MHRCLLRECSFIYIYLIFIHFICCLYFELSQFCDFDYLISQKVKSPLSIILETN